MDRFSSLVCLHHSLVRRLRRVGGGGGGEIMEEGGEGSRWGWGRGLYGMPPSIHVHKLISLYTAVCLRPRLLTTWHKCRNKKKQLLVCFPKLEHENYYNFLKQIRQFFFSL